MSGHDETPGTSGDFDARLGRVEASLQQMTADIIDQNSDVQGAMDDITHTLEGLVREGRDSTGITTVASTASDGDGDGEELGFTGWADQADADGWAGLVQWVDWLSATYALGDLGVRSCWPAHGAAIEELAALKMAWEQAIGTCVEKEWVGTEVLAYWHDRYLPGTMQRLLSVHGMKSCREGHEQRPRPMLTDTSHVVIRSTGEVPEVAVSPS